MKWCSTWLTREIQIKTTMKYHPTLVRIVVLVLVTQLCLTLCNSTDYSPPGSSVCWILQTRILKWVATPFSRGSSQPRVSCITGRLHYITLSYELQRSPTCHDGSHQKATYNKYWWGCGERQPSYSVGRNVNWYSHYGKREQFSQKRKKKKEVKLRYDLAVSLFDIYLKKTKHYWNIIFTTMFTATLFIIAT